MAKEVTINYWAQVNGGFRSSVMLRLGALALAAGVLANLGAELLAGPNQPAENATIAAWLLYILGLWLVGGAFIWIGANPFFSRFGFVVGIVHVAHGVQLFMVLFALVPFMVSQIILTTARLVSILLFAWLEADWLSLRTRRLLGAAVGLQFVKILLRIMDYLPDMGIPFVPLLDAITLLFVAAVLFHLATVVKLEEDKWAQNTYETGPSDFADFNNPEHVWNKESNGDD